MGRPARSPRPSPAPATRRRRLSPSPPPTGGGARLPAPGGNPYRGGRPPGIASLRSARGLGRRLRRRHRAAPRDPFATHTANPSSTRTLFPRHPFQGLYGRASSRHGPGARRPPRSRGGPAASAQLHQASGGKRRPPPPCRRPGGAAPASHVTPPPLPPRGRTRGGGAPPNQSARPRLPRAEGARLPHALSLAHGAAARSRGGPAVPDQLHPASGGKRRPPPLRAARRRRPGLARLTLPTAAAGPDPRRGERPKPACAALADGAGGPAYPTR